MIRSYPRISAILIGSVFAFVMVCGAEGCFYLLDQHSGLEEHDSGALFQPDALLGYKPPSQTQVTSTKRRKWNGALMYDVVYSMDAYSRRTTPVADLDRASRGSILYFGCSFTFGEGVNDGETMPADVSRLVPEYRPYNYGFRGYGPQGAAPLSAPGGASWLRSLRDGLWRSSATSFWRPGFFCCEPSRT